ncbi:MAG TPA: Hsp20/alpha crystallin family protein [Candidatus Saccharimonadales bacterium]|nr:Hsp20/alpha crystallin family protein [Candidatus Saccharimonadales bacterium]
MSLVRWNPARELSSLDDEVNRLFRSFWNREPVWAQSTASFLPPVDVEETKERYAVTVELPGLEQKDVKVSVVDNSLVIRGEKQDVRQEKDVNYHRVERCFGRFERVLQLATKVDRDRISASMKNGVLRIEVPKTEEAREREIAVDVK